MSAGTDSLAGGRSARAIPPDVVARSVALAIGNREPDSALLGRHEDDLIEGEKAEPFVYSHVRTGVLPHVSRSEGFIPPEFLDRLYAERPRAGWTETRWSGLQTFALVVAFGLIVFLVETLLTSPPSH